MPFTVILSNIVAADGLGGRFAAVVNFPRDNNAIVLCDGPGAGAGAGAMPLLFEPPPLFKFEPPPMFEPPLLLALPLFAPPLFEPLLFEPLLFAPLLLFEPPL